MDKAFIVRIFHRLQQLQIDVRNLAQAGKTAMEKAGKGAPFDERHDEVQETLFFAEFDKRQDVRMVQPRHCAGLARKATTHFGIVGVVPKNNLDGHASTECSPLPPLIYSPHTTYTNAPDDIVVTKLLAFQSQHYGCSSFPHR